MNGEISYDLVMDDDMDFVEGTYRTGGGKWNVFIFLAHGRDEATEPTFKRTVWKSGVEGFVFTVPRRIRLNRDSVQAFVAQATGVEHWTVVRGRDSMALR